MVPLCSFSVDPCHGFASNAGSPASRDRGKAQMPGCDQPLIIMKKNSSKPSLEKTKAAAESERRKLAAVAAQARQLKTQAQSAKAEVKEARKKYRKLREAVRAALKEESRARKLAEKAAFKFRKLKKKRAPKPAAKK
jgi:chromosome segregation ATPase